MIRITLLRVAIAVLVAVIIVAIGERMIDNTRRRRKLARMKRELLQTYQTRFYRAGGQGNGTKKGN